MDSRLARWERLRPPPQLVRGKQRSRRTERSAIPARASVSVLRRADRRAWSDTRRRRPGSAAEGSALSGYRQPSAYTRDRLQPSGRAIVSAFSVGRMLASFDVDRQDVLLTAASDVPSHSPTPQRVAYRRSHAPSEVVLEVTVWKADDERPSGDYAPLCSLTARVPESSGRQTRRNSFHLSGDTLRASSRSSITGRKRG